MLPARFTSLEATLLLTDILKSIRPLALFHTLFYVWHTVRKYVPSFFFFHNDPH